MHVGTILFAGLLYLCFLFLIAQIADNHLGSKKRSQPFRYALSQAVFCSSWTFLGAIGLAATGQMEYLGVYVGPILLYTIGRPLLRHIIELGKIEKSTSLSDFIAARYGKSVLVGGAVTLVAFISTLPFIVMQIKAISSTINIIERGHHEFVGFEALLSFDVPLVLIIALAIFVIIFGTKNSDVTESRNGLMTVVACDAGLKLLAVVGLSLFVLYGMFDGILDFLRQILNSELVPSLNLNFDWVRFTLIATVSLFVTILLPRQFHVAVVENYSRAEFNLAKVLFPIYLIVVNIFIFIVSVGAIIQLPNIIEPNLLFLSIPKVSNSLWVEVLVFLGCMSAVTASVIVTVVALTLMITNSVILPILLRRDGLLNAISQNNIPKFMHNLRRAIIVLIFICVFVFYRLVGDYGAFAVSGLLVFMAMAQLAPAMFGGLLWRKANSKAALSSVCVGFIAWLIMLFIPVVFNLDVFSSFGLEGLQISADKFVNGAIYSLLFNVTAFVLVALFTKPTELEKEQAELFMFYGKQSLPLNEVSAADLRIGELCKTVELYLGSERCNAAFASYGEEVGREFDLNDKVDAKMLRHAEHVLASALGTASANLVLSLLIKRGTAAPNNETYKLLGAASQALKENQDILRHALDQVDQAITVFNADCALVNWNKQFREMLHLPKEYGEAGCHLEDIAKGIVAHNKLDTEFNHDVIATKLKDVGKSWVLEIEDEDISIEILSNTMPDGGLVISWNDISDKVRAARTLHVANESLERRVESRTKELTSTNQKLAIATKTAQEANLSKTRFLAAAGHDILQPLNAARLYTSTLLERATKTGDGKLEQNILDSLSSVEDILDAVISISKLDSGSMQPNLNYFSVEKLFTQLQVEFAPIAESKNVELRFVQSTLWVRSDQNFLRRILQNLISNGIKYAPRGKVLVGCRRHKNMVVFEILDNGLGITEKEQEKVFAEFTRLDSGAKVAAGLGLGLSIVQRVAQILNHPLKLKSEAGKGSKFSLTVPIAASLSRRMDGQALRRPKRRVDIAGMKILCIDNEQGILDGMEALLKEWDCDVMTALSKEAAFEVLGKRTEIIDFIVADYHLDEGTGIDAVVAIREHYKSPIPAVLATADRSEEVQENAARTELSILRKPIKPAALRALLASRRKRRTPQDISL